MKKPTLLFIGFFLFISFVVFGCIRTDDDTDYGRRTFNSREEVSNVRVTDESTDIVLKHSNKDKLLVEYTDSKTEPWYDIEILNGTLKIEKIRSTVGVEGSPLIIYLPQKEYEEIFVDTTNGNINFEEISATAYNCITENGNIEGTLIGEEKDYSHVVSVENGKSTLRNNTVNSSKSIELNVRNGNIEIEFDS